MKKFQRKICILLAAAVTLSCSINSFAQSEPFVSVYEKEAASDKTDKKDVFSVRIPCDVSFKITLLEGTDVGWVSSDDFTLENCGSNDVIVKFESVYYKFNDDENFVSVESEDEVKSITDKKAFFMKMMCSGTVNREEYIIKDTVSEETEDVEFLLKAPQDTENNNNEELSENKGIFKFMGAANPLSDIKWKDKDVTVQINFSIYNADTKEFIEQKTIMSGTKEEENISETEETTVERSNEVTTETTSEIETESSTENTTEETSEITTEQITVSEQQPIADNGNNQDNNNLNLNADTSSSSLGGGSSKDKTATPVAVEISVINDDKADKNKSNGSSGGSSGKTTTPSAVDSITTPTAVDIQTTETTVTESTTATETSTESTTVTETSTETTSQELTETVTDNVLSDSAVNISDDISSSSSVEVDTAPVSKNGTVNNKNGINSNTDIVENKED